MKQQADSTILTRGLRRVLFGATIMGILLASLQIVAVSKLKHEIDQWAWTSELDGLRERLFLKTANLLGGNADVNISEVITSFESLQRAIGEGAQHNEQEPFIKDVAALEAEARNHFVRSEEKRDVIVPYRDKFARGIDTLQSITAGWYKEIGVEEQNILRESNLVDARTRDIGDLRVALTSALINAQLLQQQIVAIDRLSKTSPAEITLSSIDTLDISGIPTVCAAQEKEIGGRLCSPSIARVRTAVTQLKQAEPAAISTNVRLSLLGLEGYIRAGQGRLKALAEENRNAVNRTRLVRQRLSAVNDLSTSLNRVNLFLQELQTQLELPTPTAASLVIADRQIQYHISQIRIRMSGLLGLSPVLHGDPDVISTATATMADSWTSIRQSTQERIALLTAFERTMGTLSTKITEHAELVRNETTLWVNVYVSNFVVLAGLFSASVMGLIWLARRRLVTPLAQVTGTIIGLARGDLDRAVVLSERSFGFDTLGNALEQLRLEMNERQQLSERNKQQQQIIESNLADIRRTSDEMEWMAMHDPLTGLGNRRQADLDLEELTRKNTAGRQDFCVMQIDIDRFKAVNDALGHTAGDYVLSTVSVILLTNVAPQARCYRTGGDEFLLIWSDKITKEQASSIAQSLISQIKEPIEFDGQQCNVGASIGIAYGSDTDFVASRAVINADLALYEVKRAGRDGFKFFTEELASLSLRQKDLSDRLVIAIEQELFQPYYQPQFYAQTRKLRGVEVLCRWNDDVLGWISPGEFLTLAEDLNVVAKIDEILFEKVAHDLRALAKTADPVPRVSFNITVDRLLQHGLAQELIAKIGDHTKIALELLESTSLDNPTDTFNHAIDDFKEHGIEIEIDDFGSDRASLAGLMAVHPQAMKIDRSIVIPIINSQRHTDLVKKIIDIGIALNVEVVAEGVETEDHAQQLSALGCHVLQGFGLAKPMPFEDLVAFCNLNTTNKNDPPAVA
ncbi:MAG: GGDEF domain-containing protein [Silicimonas sp.]|nr:GGDEF domain-containing protein [Silicimonas sp.]